jgi:hypothetical protein
MKKIFAALLFVCAAIALHGQSIFVPGGINYGGSLTIKETQGTGAPTPSCSGFIRYWQTDAATSPMWECLGGSMVNIGTGSGGGGSSFAVTTTATGLQSLTGAFQAPNIFVGSTDTNLFRCGATCLGLGSSAGTANGSLQVLSLTGSTNGVLNPALFAGADIGAKVNAALATLSGGGTVRIPTGAYSFATTIRITAARQRVECDAGTVLNYTGSTDAIAFISPIATGSAGWQLDGGNGCTLNGSASTGSANGIRMFPSAVGAVTGMHVLAFANGAALRIDGANSVQIHDNLFNNSKYGIYTVSAPFTSTGTYVYTGGCCGFAPNALHIHDNEIGGNQWGYFSANGQVTATRGLGNSIHDNAFEAQTLGDIRLGWDAHTSIAKNYFESSGVAISVGVAADNINDIHIEDNYFTISSAERSEIEVGHGFDLFISGNYEEGPNSASSGCSINVIPDSGGSFNNVVATNAFARSSEARAGTPTTNEFCVNGTPSGNTGGTIRFMSNVTMPTLNVAGAPTLNSALVGTYPVGNTIIGVIGPVTIWAGPGAPAGGCPTTQATIWFSPAGLSVCKSGVWTLE